MAAIESPVRDGGFITFLRDRGILNDASGPRADRADLESLWRSGVATGAELADAAAEFHGLRRASFAELSQRPPAFQDLSRRYLREAAIFPFSQDGRAVLAVADPARREPVEAVRLALGGEAELVVVTFDEVDLLFERAGAEEPAVEPDLADAGEGEAAVALSDSVEALQDLARGAPIVRTIDQMLERALEAGATDIHVETGRDNLRVRFRVDGYLRPDQSFPKHLAPAIISRIKILASLDIAERRLPQDGRANIRIGNQEADLRVAIAPTLYGETAVLRILLKDTRLLELGRIGMTEADQRIFESLIEEPHGIVIVTGPTGSGKTTTLATAMSMLNDPTRKIITVEDPIEYQLPGIHQTQIRAQIGLTFAAALRSFLRHDPDVIMVGEMRDGETASIGIQAALTGHLVLTTLHTNTAADAVIRLADMGVEPYLIASTLRGVLGQRLVRRLCERCKRPDAREADIAEGLAETRGFRMDPSWVFHGPVGCEACGHTGYRGRVGIFEAMRVDGELRHHIRHEPDPQKILEIARAGGMTSMLEDGLMKSGLGVTSMEEVLRTTG
ncbi:GspE/PulE family protein [Oharaeibacter diazotrophicus]|uniref:General secretion pathway protein E n=1 Tax=Oharaeibacter diazotrophicus TaxID=1920512 RepID=A0A4R6R6L4_9HYPH|nr:GspE/PulE family protein [Oharaeibacter diazotrophicus]TDP81444.1 general secretion pathway protein E [Oharaeibacter diazotrophicus]BBE73682.1 type II secretion system protein E [Pleomorphomonas sp. SM30]GLS75471.1 general secretion pathway protein GspE [Oharaeibacter diazotrophicus]